MSHSVARAQSLFLQSLFVQLMMELEGLPLRPTESDEEDGSSWPSPELDTGSFLSEVSPTGSSAIGGHLDLRMVSRL